jgi:hypothetical protein
MTFRDSFLFGVIAAALALCSGCHRQATPDEQSRIIQENACEARALLAIDRNATRADLCKELAAVSPADPCADHFAASRKAVCP